MQKRFASMRPSADLSQITALLSVPDRSDSSPGVPFDITQVSAAQAEITIYDLIGWDGVTAAQFIKELNAVRASHITLRVSSDGGVVSDGLAIYSALLRHPAKIHAYVDGMAASAASFVVMAGDIVTMSPKSRMMIHDAVMVAGGPADFLRQQANILDKESDNIAAIYADKAGGTVEEWRDRMKAETWFSDREAVEAGLADNIDGVEIEAKVEPIVNEAEPEEPHGTVETQEPEPTPVDFAGLMDEIADELTEEELYATA